MKVKQLVILLSLLAASAYAGEKRVKQGSTSKKVSEQRPIKKLRTDALVATEKKLEQKLSFSCYSAHDEFFKGVEDPGLLEEDIRWHIFSFLVDPNNLISSIKNMVLFRRLNRGIRERFSDQRIVQAATQQLLKDSQPERKQTLLHYFVEHIAPLPLIKMAVQEGVKAEGRDSKGQTPLHYLAAQDGLSLPYRIDVSNFLIRHVGVSDCSCVYRSNECFVCIRDAKESTADELAVRHGRREFANYLLSGAWK